MLFSQGGEPPSIYTTCMQDQRRSSSRSNAANAMVSEKSVLNRDADLLWACIEIVSFFLNSQLTVALERCHPENLMVSVVVAQ